MASKVNFSKWGFLVKLGVSEDQLLNALVRGDPINNCLLNNEHPTYGVLFELYYFANDNTDRLHRRPNRILKCLMDMLYPVSRADRFERRVKILCSHLQNMTMEEVQEFLQNTWIPRPTGTI